MKSFSEVEIRWKAETKPTVHQILRAFSKANTAWKFLPKQTADYQRAIDGPAAMVLCLKPGCQSAAVALANIKKEQVRRLRVTNIVPVQCGQLSVDEYNAIAAAFASDLQQYARAAKCGLTVEFKTGDKGLADIIPGKRTRNFFESYLNAHPLSFHPSDLQRLDVFICSLVWYGSKVNTHDVHAYLAGDLGWPHDKAAFVRDRIETGLAVLDVYRRGR